MIISHKHKFIYFKAQKVAGTSTEIILGNFCGDQDIVTPIFPPVERIKGARNYEGFRNHNIPKYIKNKIGSEIFNSYFKFITVRNPFDRAVSWYWYKYSESRLRKSFRDFVLKTRCAGLVSFSNWLFVENKCLIDDYVRYERLEADTKRILGKWFDYDIAFPTAKTKERKSDKHYTEYYDDETREIIAKKYAKDIEHFGYKFGE